MSNINNTSRGFYFNRKTWDIQLEKGLDTTTIKVPTLVMLLLAPALGATLVLFLPFVGIFLFGKALIDKLFRLSVPHGLDSEPSTKSQNN
jgi:hypothetical protein